MSSNSNINCNIYFLLDASSSQYNKTIAINNQTSIQNIKTQIQASINTTNNYVLSLTPDYTQIIKSVAWAKFTSLDQVKKMYRSNSSSSTNTQYSPSTSSDITASNTPINIYVLPPNTTSVSPSTSPNMFSSPIPPPQQQDERLKPTPSLRKSKSDLQTSFYLNREFINDKISSINSPTIPTSTGSNGSSNYNNNAINNNNNSSNSNNNYSSVNYTSNYSNRFSNSSSSSNSSNSSSGSSEYNRYSTYSDNRGSISSNYSSASSYSSNNINRFPVPNTPGQLIYQPSMHSGVNQQQQQKPISRLPSTTISPPSPRSSNSKSASSTTGILEYKPRISISPPTIIEPSSTTTITTSPPNKSNKLESIDLKLLDQMVEEISTNNNSNQSRVERKRSKSFSTPVGAFLDQIYSSSSNNNNTSSNTLQISPPIISTPIPQPNNNIPTIRERSLSQTPAPNTYYTDSKYKFESPIIHSGDLYKKNRNMVGWKKRYFVLTKDKLIYSDSQTDVPRKEIPLLDFVVNMVSDGSKYYCFTLTNISSGGSGGNGNGNSNGLSYLLGTDDDVGRREWIIALSLTYKPINLTFPSTIDLPPQRSKPIPTCSTPISSTFIDYHKKLPGELRVPFQCQEITLFRYKMSRLITILQPYIYTPDHLWHAQLLIDSNNILSSPPPSSSPKPPTQQPLSNDAYKPKVPQVVSINMISDKVNSNNNSIKVSILHNGLVIKFLVNVNQYLKSIFEIRPDLFGCTNPSSKYGLNIIGTVEYIFSHDKVKLSDLIYVQKSIRFKKSIKFQTCDINLQSKLFYPNKMDTTEWRKLLTNVDLNPPDSNSNSGNNNLYTISINSNSIDKLTQSFDKLKLLFRVVSVSNISMLLKKFYSPNQVSKVYLYVEIQILYGDKVWAKNRTSCKMSGEWNEDLFFDINLLDFPKESIFLTSLYSRLPNSDQATLLAQSPHEFQSLDQKKIIQNQFNILLLPNTGSSSTSSTNLLTSPPPQTGTTSKTASASFISSDQNPLLVVQIPYLPKEYPIFFDESSAASSGNIKSPKAISYEKSTEISNLVERILKADRSSIPEGDRSTLWTHREFCRVYFPNVLPSLIYNYPIHSIFYRVSLYELLENWPLVEPSFGLELLSSDFSDDIVRKKGVESINQWSDNDLAMYLPQIVQAVKYEDNHFSPLSTFIVKRSICNPFIIGQSCFWLCCNQVNASNKLHVVTRYRLIMEAIIEGLGVDNQKQGQSLLQQYLIVQLLKQLNLDIINMKEPTPEKRKKIFHTRLSSFPAEFSLPCAPLSQFNGFAMEELKVKDSNAAPLWLVFTSIHPLADKTKIIFKKDDVRPDELCLQLFSIMDRILTSNGIDCYFTLFNCMSVGAGLGLIEVVPNSITLADFMRDKIQYPSIEQWLQKKNPTNDNYIDIFFKSCAAYSVATYLLGIYDRHNDNLMLSETGHFFHIDFGYFLGKVTKFLLFERETAPFVLTSDIVQMLGSKEKEFRELCCKIYNIIRNNSRELLNLVSMSKFEETSLVSEQNKNLLRDRLKLDLSDTDATNHFLHLIKESKSNIRAELNNVIHVMVHPN
ncbi:hypothetical protein CYY_002924 [Polysphondylium violaceum]|uniref:Phosphatidylinositol 3-kinase n=1 Tax=Polysphondylium violaceum TaxID=133409 RepID=A0A8J4Q7E8_9MYCE|nr:hypothetical protein CYY_002924 [Polysphondylium violaceum]